MLRDELTRLQTLQQHSRTGAGRHAPARNPMSLQHLVKATQHLDRLEDLFAKIVDGIASAALVSRVGLFYRADGEGNFRLHAGRCCLDDTSALEFSDRDPLVRWLQRHPRLITRASLDHIAEPGERALLRRTLDMLGAETFIPLNLRGRVLGWLFTGQTDGLPFDHSDHPELSFLSEHVVHALENTIKHHEVVSQKNLGENLLQMMPTAIITSNPEGVCHLVQLSGGKIVSHAGTGVGAQQPGRGEPSHAPGAVGGFGQPACRPDPRRPGRRTDPAAFLPGKPPGGRTDAGRADPATDRRRQMPRRGGVGGRHHRSGHGGRADRSNWSAPGSGVNSRRA